MDLNKTMLGQMITFALFIWFTMRFVWPVLTAAMDERKKKIADGLAAAEKGQRALADARDEIDAKMRQVKSECHDLLANAQKTAAEIIEEARGAAEVERTKIVAAGQEQVDRAVHQARVALQKELAGLVVLGTKKILQRDVTDKDHNKMLDDLAQELQ